MSELVMMSGYFLGPFPLDMFLSSKLCSGLKAGSRSLLSFTVLDFCFTYPVNGVFSFSFFLGCLQFHN